MTTSKPGSVNQQPLYGCTSCYEECIYPADHLHVYDNECWCDLCWDERRWEFPDQPSWNDLEPYTPALQAECKELRTALSESRANDLTAMGYLNQIRELVGGDDFPDMVERVAKLQAECDNLRKDAKRYVPLNEAVQRAAAELPEGWEIQLCVMRDSGWVDLIGPEGTEDFATDNERLDYTVIDALEFAIDAATQGDQP